MGRGIESILKAPARPKVLSIRVSKKTMNDGNEASLAQHGQKFHPKIGWKRGEVTVLP